MEADQPPTHSQGGEATEFEQILRRNALPESDMIRLYEIIREAQVRVQSEPAEPRPDPPRRSPTPSSLPTSSDALPAQTFTFQQLTQLLSTAARPPQSRLAEAQPPEKFSGKPEEVEPFLSAARRWIAMAESKVPTLRSRFLWALSFFVEKAEPWQRAYSDAMSTGKNMPWSSWEEFEEAVRLGFGAVSRTHEAQQAVHNIRMRQRESLSEFVVRFRSDASEAGFNDASLITYFRNAIPAVTQKEIVTLAGGTFPIVISEWYRLAQTITHIENAIGNTSAPTAPLRTSLPRTHAPDAVVAPTPAPAPVTSDAMDVDAHVRSFRGSCYNCGQTGHKSFRCPKPRKTRQGFLSEEELQSLRKLLPKSSEDFPAVQQ